MLKKALLTVVLVFSFSNVIFAADYISAEPRPGVNGAVISITMSNYAVTVDGQGSRFIISDLGNSNGNADYVMDSISGTITATLSSDNSKGSGNARVGYQKSLGSDNYNSMLATILAAKAAGKKITAVFYGGIEAVLTNVQYAYPSTDNSYLLPYTGPNGEQPAVYLLQSIVVID